MAADPYAEIQRLVSLLPGSEHELLSFARGLSAEGQVEISAELLRRAIEQYATPTIRLELGNVYGRMGRHKEAMSEMVHVLKLDPGHPEALLQMAESLLECGENDRATKILDKALMSGVDPNRVEMVRRKGPRIPDEATEPNAFLEASDPTQDNRAPRRRRTAAGGPNSAFPIESVSPDAVPRITAGTLDRLSYGDGPAPDDSILQEVPNVGNDTAFDQLLSDMGVPIDDPGPAFVPPPAVIPPPEHLQVRAPHPPPPTVSPEPDTAGPDDRTMALIMDASHELASASDATAALVVEDQFLTSSPAPLPKSAQSADIPSLEYDPSFAQEISEVRDDLGKLEHQSGFMQASYDELADALGQYPEPVQAAPNPPSEALTPGIGVVLPSAVRSVTPGQMKPEVRRVETTVPQEHAKRPVPKKPVPKKKAVFIGLGVAGLALFVVALVALSSINETSGIEDLLEQAQVETAPDTYVGYVSARRTLARASEYSGFLGVALPGSKGPKLREQARSGLAWVSALLYVRFGEDIADEVQMDLAAAPSDDPWTIAAQAYSFLGANHPHRALQILEQPSGSTPSPAIEEARVLTQLRLRRIDEAAAAAESLHDIKNATIRTRLVTAMAERQAGKNVTPELELILQESPDHVEARVEMVYAIVGAKKPDLPKARSYLDEVLKGKLKEGASSYQIAQATAADGLLKSAEGDQERAEIRFKDAIQLLPHRADFYVPLLEMYIRKGRFDDAEKYFKRADENKAVSPELSLLKGEYLVRISAPDKAVHELQQLDFEDSRKQWWLTLGYFDLGRIDDAQAAATAGMKMPGARLGLEATAHLLRSLRGDKDSSDEAYALQQMAKKHPKDPWVLWAAAKSLYAKVKRTKDHSARTQNLKEGLAFMKAAIAISPAEERYHFFACRLYLEKSAEKSAEKACKRGRKLNKLFVGGALALSALRRTQGQTKEAMAVVAPLVKKRPDDALLGLELARVYLASGKLDDAESLVNRFLGKTADVLTINVLQGRIALERRAYTKAAGYLQKAAEVDPHDGEALAFYGHTLAILGKTEEAGRLLLTALNDPVWGGHSWMFLGDLRRRQKRFKDALQNFSKARKKFKSNAGARSRYSTLYAWRALTYRDQHDWNHPRVAQALRQAADLGDEDDPEYRWVAAQLALGQKKPDLEAAEKHLGVIALVAPYRCNAVDTWVRVLESLGNTKKLEEAKLVQLENCKVDE